MLQAEEIVNGKYEIIGLIGRGGMSAVYKARDLATGCLLAVKDVERNKETGNRVFEERLTEEGHMLKRLSNTHLPKIYDIIESKDSFMLVMDFVEGESLDKVIARSGAQAEAYVYNWGMQICDVFTYLHEQDPPIIYRDMKPANVILQSDGKLMLIDFGTARTQKFSQGLSSDTICIGTEGFAAPEQYGGLGESDARTDIFCLGATLYNMITGHSPYEEPRGILPLGRWSPELADSPLNDIINKCTQRSPFDRYQTAKELRMDLALAESGLLKVGGKKTPLPQGWQRQQTKSAGGLTGGLSGLLQRGAKAQEKKQAAANGTQTFRPEPEKKKPWQQISLTPDGPGSTQGFGRPDGQQAAQAAREPESGAKPSAQGGGLWSRTLIIAAAAAAAMLLLSVLLNLGGAVQAAVISLIFAAATVCLAVVSLVMLLRERDDGTSGSGGR